MKILDKIEKFLSEGWMKHGNIYSAEASSIEHHINTKKQEVKCPKCRNDIPTKAVFQNPKYDREREITHWESRCPTCSAQLKIFND